MRIKPILRGFRLQVMGFGLAAAALALLAPHGPLAGVRSAMAGEAVSYTTGQDPKTTLQKQMDAVRARDMEAAFALLSPALRAKYADAAAFFKELRFGYRPLYKHLGFSFLSGSAEGDVSFQRIQVTGSGDAPPQIVLVRLSRQDGGIWLVDGYTVLEAEEDPL